MADRVIVFNGGSSSVKLSLFEKADLHEGSPVWNKNLAINLLDASGQEVHELVAGHLQEAQIERQSIDCVGHRVVHGGTELQEPLFVDQQVENKIEKYIELAPVHNLIALKLIREARRLFPQAEQVAVFDTAFHRTLPPEAYLYAIPYDWNEKFGIRRFGFHGINHQYCAGAARAFLSIERKDLRLVSCHLGNGCSLAAIHNGKSVDTTMGFTPLEGLMMGARSGSIDPGIIFYLLEENKFSVQELDRLLNNSSGLLGISGLSKDMQKIEEARSNGNERSQLAFKMFARSVSKSIAAMATAMGGIDAIVFTGGTGEHSAALREEVCTQLNFLGIELDQQINQRCNSDGILSKNNSRVQVLRIAAREELQIYRECLSIMSREPGQTVE